MYKGGYGESLAEGVELRLPCWRRSSPWPTLLQFQLMVIRGICISVARVPVTTVLQPSPSAGVLSARLSVLPLVEWPTRLLGHLSSFDCKHVPFMPLTGHLVSPLCQMCSTDYNLYF